MPELYVTDMTNLGKYIKTYRQIDTDRAAYATIEAEIAALMDDSADELTGLKNVLQVIQNMDSALDGYQVQLVSAAKADIIQAIMAGDVDYVGTSKDVIGILEKLAEEMTAHSDSINGSAVTIGSPTYMDANAGTLLAALASATQLVGNEAFELEVVSVPSAGTERWKVTGEPSLHGQLPTQVVSAGGATVIYDNNGQALFTVTVTPYTAGTGYKLSGDAGGIISVYTLTGAVKGSNTSAAGDLYPSVVDDGGGDWHVDIYKDSGRTSKVAHTATFTTTGAKALVADGGSGLTGSVTVTALTAVADAVVRVGFALAVGDRVKFATTNDDGGKFAKFFREELGVAIPVNLAGGETIADTLCE